MSDHASVRTRLAGMSMVAGGLLMLIPPFLGPANGSDDTRQRLVDLAASPGQTVAKSLVFQAAVILLLPGVAAIVGRTRGRGSGAVVSGGVVFGAGLVGAYTFMVLFGMEVAIAQSGPVDANLVAAADHLAGAPAAVPALVLALLLFHLVGLPWLAFGMVRARQIPVWLAVAATVGTACAFFGSGTRVEAIGWVLVGLSLAALGMTIGRPGVWGPSPKPVRLDAGAGGHVQATVQRPGAVQTADRAPEHVS